MIDYAKFQTRMCHHVIKRNHVIIWKSMEFETWFFSKWFQRIIINYFLIGVILDRCPNYQMKLSNYYSMKIYMKFLSWNKFASIRSNLWIRICIFIYFYNDLIHLIFKTILSKSFRWSEVINYKNFHLFLNYNS